MHTKPITRITDNFRKISESSMIVSNMLMIIMIQVIEKSIIKRPQFIFQIFLFPFWAWLILPHKGTPKAQIIFGSLARPWTLWHPKIILLRCREPRELETLLPGTPQIKILAIIKKNLSPKVSQKVNKNIWQINWRLLIPFLYWAPLVCVAVVHVLAVDLVLDLYGVVHPVWVH